jgi:hypothetical protein
MKIHRTGRKPAVKKSDLICPDFRDIQGSYDFLIRNILSVMHDLAETLQDIIVIAYGPRGISPDIPDITYVFAYDIRHFTGNMPISAAFALI